MNRPGYKRLGEYIERCDERNSSQLFSVSHLKGVNNEGKVFPSIAKTSGLDLSVYKIAHPGDFIYNPARLDLGSIARLEGDSCIVSTLYVVFRVKENKLNELLPEYLEMWIHRSEFHRYVSYVNWGSAREYFWYDDMCEVFLPIPDIAKQKRIVSEYHALKDRIVTNNKLICKLEETAQTIYNKLFVDDINISQLPQGWRFATIKELVKVKGGKRLPKGEELTEFPNTHPYIKVADMTSNRFIELNQSFQFVSDDVQSAISRYIVNEGDVIISIVGTIGNVNIVGASLDKANLTENCVKLVGDRSFSNLLFAFLKSPEGKKQMEQAIVGGVQSKLPIYNIEKLRLLLPDNKTLEVFNARIGVINETISNAIKENILLTEMICLIQGRMSA